jgi:hypothetical protein
MKSGRDWRKARLSGKPSLSTRDETEFRDRDAAARWLARNEKPKSKPHRRRLSEARAG